jgi:hypothetical protein
MIPIAMSIEMQFRSSGTPLHEVSKRRPLAGPNALVPNRQTKTVSLKTAV